MTKFERRREKMVRRQLVARGIEDESILAAMASVPRHLFVDEKHVYEAYDDRPLPVGWGQTISQPYMVAVMTERLSLSGAGKVLEIGTGSGYQTAILAETAAEVFTIERIPELAARARNVLDGLGYRNISYKTGDGSLGWPGEAPFDRILVTAGAPQVPNSLSNQLAEGGRLVIPTGSKHSQTLQVIRKGDGRLKVVDDCQCVFVKLIGDEGWHE